MKDQFNRDTKFMTEIKKIEEYAIPSLLEMLPCDCFHKAEFSKEGDLWRLEFKCNFIRGHFTACAVRETPREAFAAVRERVLAQVDLWHESRFMDRGPHPAFIWNTTPRILLVDDDEDLALAMNLAFDKLGWQADLAVRHEGLHRKLADREIDCIVLDWNLNNSVTADKVFEKAIRLIDAFSDLREKFRKNKPRIVTYSVLDREQIKLPPEGVKYFEHVDHCLKTQPIHEIIDRVTRMMKSSKGEEKWAGNS